VAQVSKIYNANGILENMTRYHYREGVALDKKRNRWLLGLIWLLVVAAAVYIAAIYLTPQLVTVPFTRLTAAAVDTKIQQSKAGQYGDRLFLPQINVDVPVHIGGDQQALASGAWQRNTNLGDPAKNGNVALSAPKFTWALTPQAARAKSPFYNLGKINDGDEVTLDYKGTRYVYRIDHKTTVNTGAASIEQKTDDARLTLYATDATGNAVAGPVLSGKLISPAKQTADSNFGG